MSTLKTIKRAQRRRRLWRRWRWLTGRPIESHVGMSRRADGVQIRVTDTRGRYVEVDLSVPMVRSIYSALGELLENNE